LIVDMSQHFPLASDFMQKRDGLRRGAGGRIQGQPDRSFCRVERSYCSALAMGSVTVRATIFSQ
jgi:hypothetical protein